MLQIPDARIDGERGHPDHQDHHASGKDADRPPLIHHQPFHRGCSRLESASARLWRIWSLPGASSAACRSTKAARSTAPVWSSAKPKIGRTAGRGRGLQYVEIWGVGGALKKKKK